MQILAIPSTRTSPLQTTFVLNEWDSCSDLNLTLNLTAPAKLRISVISKKNDNISIVKDFGFVNYPEGDTDLSIGETSGMIGINLHFDDELVFVSRAEGYKSTADMNKSYATVYVNYALSQAYTVAFPTLSSLLSTAPQPGMRATASDAPGSMLSASGADWIGSLGYGGWATVGGIPTTNVGAGSTAYLADGSEASYSGTAWAVASGTPYANFPALVAAVPSPTVGQTAQIAGGGIVVYTETGWLGNLGVFATLAAAQALTGVADGSTCTVSGDGIVYVSKAV